MKNIEFYKFQAAGNDFIIIDKEKFLKNKSNNYLKQFVKKICSRKKSVGSDGVLFVEPAVKGGLRMRIFNSDGSEAEMCGNGARCAALWGFIFQKKQTINLYTKAGVIKAYFQKKIKDDFFPFKAKVAIKTSVPYGVKEDIPITILNKKIKVNFVNTGVPHAVIFVEGLEKIDIETIAPKIRFHKKFLPAGVNVNLVEVKARNLLSVRTYERGVEAETLACGTGSIAAAVIYSLKKGKKGSLPEKIKIKTKGDETLAVSFKYLQGKINEVCLEAKASYVYFGKI